MPRPERPLDGTDDALTEFASDLRALRDRAGRPGYRKLAIKAHYSATTLSDAAGGRDLPSLAVTLAYVRACGGNPADWEQRWHTLAAQRAPHRPSADPHTNDRADGPYVGLAAFEPDDAGRFFGRDALTEDVVDRVQARRFVAVFGASGAGKSSVLRAGLIARMRQPTDGRTAIPVLLTPGQHPVEECAVALATLTGHSAPALRSNLLADPDALYLHVRHAVADRPPDTDLLLVVDQFEEVFTLCHDEQERHAFITALVHATQPTTSRLRVVLGVRTDFYTHCAGVPDLVEALRDTQILVGPMTPEQLRSAITQPAAQAGCTVENALLAAVIADCAAEPAVLPLLSHALRETWRRRRGTTLTLAGYQAAGGITHAIAHTAEHVHEHLDDTQRRLVKSLFLRLTALGEGTEDTKRRVRRAELDTTDPHTTAVLDHLTRSRLITVDRDRIEITHEALIRCWPRLRDWLATDRDGLRIHRQLTEDTHTWLALNRDPDTLYRGSRLATADEWHRVADAVITPNEREFLTASLAAQTRERAVARRRTRRLRQLVVLLSVLLLVAGITTLTAVRAQQTATQQRDLALAQNALSEAAALRATDPALALQLTLAAYRLTRTQQTSSGVLNALAMPYAQHLAGSPNVMAVSPDGRLLATLDDDRTARIWDLTRPHHPVTLATIQGLVGPTTLAGFSPDGRLLSLAEPAGAQLWDVTMPRHPRLVTTFAQASGAMVDADEHLLATTGYAGVQLWDSTDLRRPALLATLPTGQAATATFSADGHALAVRVFTGSAIGVQLWDITNPRQPIRAATAFTAAGSTDRVSFSPTEPILAVGTDTGATLWDITNPRQPNPIGSLGQTDVTVSVAFSADGRTLATGSLNGSVSLWNIDIPSHPHQVTTVTAAATGATALAFGPGGHTLLAAAGRAIGLIDLPQLALVGDTQVAAAATISPDGRALATTTAPTDAALSSRTQIWDLTDLNQPTPTATLPTDPTPGQYLTGGGLVFSPHGSILATSDRQQTRLWDLSNRQHPSELATLPQSGSPAAFSPDGQMLITIGDNSSGQLWDIRRPRQPRTIVDLGVLDGPTSVAFSPRGHVLATIWGDQVVRLWDMTNVGRPRMIATMPGGTEYGATLTFAPDGHLLAANGANGTIRLWNVTDPTHPALLTTLPGDPNNLNTIAFSPDSRTLAIPGAGQTIQLWDLTLPAYPTVRAVLTNALRPVAFHPDGHTLAVIGSNNSIQLRQTDLDRAAAQICALTTTTITRATWDRYFPGQPYQPPCP
jgi:WD40 repeat protein